MTKKLLKKVIQLISSRCDVKPLVAFYCKKKSMIKVKVITTIINMYMIKVDYRINMCLISVINNNVDPLPATSIQGCP